MAGKRESDLSKKETTKKSKPSKEEKNFDPEFHVGILTYDEDFSDLSNNDAQVRAALRDLNIDSEYIIWTKDLPDLKTFDAVIILSTWDYHTTKETCQNFLNVLSTIEKKVPFLWNPRATIEWNSKKTYLQDLKDNGVPIIETRWLFKGQCEELKTIVETEGWKDFVVKPVISAGGVQTFRSTSDKVQEIIAQLNQLDTEEWMVQPFAEEIVKEGEYSFFFIKDHFSHSIVKKPAKNNFLVQNRYGGKAHAAKPNQEWIQQAHNVLKKCDHEYLFARVDGVIRDGTLTLMELEMIEPYLFLDFGKNFCPVFAKTIQSILKNHKEAKGSS